MSTGQCVPDTDRTQQKLCCMWSGAEAFCSLLTSPPPKIERNQLIQTGLWLEKN